MDAALRRVIGRWIGGVVAGTLLVGLTSPLFVRTFHTSVDDPVRGVPVMRPGLRYRWRSEGYAVTRVGPHGMPGKVTIESAAGVVRVALWGDSQAEGVCLADRLKLFAQAEREAARRGSGETEVWDVYPLARSGDDISHWLAQMPRAEDAFAIDAHVILVADVLDLRTAPLAPIERQVDGTPAAAWIDRRTLTRHFPAFVIQAGRRLLTGPDGTSRRQLRFAPGPAPESPRGGPPRENVFDWPARMAAIRDTADAPVVLLYAPRVPTIRRGELVTVEPDVEQVAPMRAAAGDAGIRVVDLRPRFVRSAANRTFPHGFHNGQIGVGHLNADGYAIVAGALVDAVRDSLTAGVAASDG